MWSRVCVMLWFFFFLVVGEVSLITGVLVNQQIRHEHHQTWCAQNRFLPSPIKLFSWKFLAFNYSAFLFSYFVLIIHFLMVSIRYWFTPKLWRFFLAFERSFYGLFNDNWLRVIKLIVFWCFMLLKQLWHFFYKRNKEGNVLFSFSSSINIMKVPHDEFHRFRLLNILQICARRFLGFIKSLGMRDKRKKKT